VLNTTKSEELYKVALDLMPGGVNSPVRAFGAVGRNPLFIDHAKGSYVYDVDGNKFIDYVCSWGPGILGHSHPEVLEEVVKACFDGLTFGAPTGKENELAQLVKDCVPSMEMMRMVSSGTEATMSAIRAARGFTGRDKIIKFKGCYHGHSDGLLVQAGSAALTQSVPDSSGVPASFAQQTLVALYNDKDSVRELFENNKDQIAALIVEPVAANMGVVIPDDDFLSFVRLQKRMEQFLFLTRLSQDSVLVLAVHRSGLELSQIYLLSERLSAVECQWLSMADVRIL